MCGSVDIHQSHSKLLSELINANTLFEVCRGKQKSQRQGSWFVFIVVFVKLLLSWSFRDFLIKQQYINYSQNYPYHLLENQVWMPGGDGHCDEQVLESQRPTLFEVSLLLLSTYDSVAGMTGPISASELPFL